MSWSPDYFRQSLLGQRCVVDFGAEAIWLSYTGRDVGGLDAVILSDRPGHFPDGSDEESDNHFGFTGYNKMISLVISVVY